MNKKLLVAAVAAALAAPGIALAQVTITGKVGAMWNNFKVSGDTAGLRGGNKSVNAITDNTSTLSFRVREDLGGGLAVYGQFEFRPLVESGNNGANPYTGSGAPPQWLGLQSTTWGNLRVGTLTGLHYVTGPDLTATRGTAFNSVQATQGGVSSGAVLASGTRWRNTVGWDSPSWGGFKLTAAYSTGQAADNDLGVAARKGRAWNLIPQFQAANWDIGWSVFNNKLDAPVAATPDEEGHRLYGSYRFANGFSVGASWDHLERELALTGVQINKRDAWSLQGAYDFGAHSVAVHYTKAEKDKVALGTGGAVGTDTDASAWGAAYQYSLSKRTNAFVSFQRITNKAAAAYGAGGFQTPPYSPATGLVILPGEDITSLMIGMNHNF